MFPIPLLVNLKTNGKRLMGHDMQLKQLEFQDLIMFLQHLPTKDWKRPEVSRFIHLSPNSPLCETPNVAARGYPV